MKTMCKMNEWQYLPRDRTIALMLSTKHRSLWISVFSITSHLADFGRLLKTSDFFGNFRKWSCRLQKSQHSEDKKSHAYISEKVGRYMLVVTLMKVTNQPMNLWSLSLGNDVLYTAASIVGTTHEHASEDLSHLVQNKLQHLFQH